VRLVTTFPEPCVRGRTGVEGDVKRALLILLVAAAAHVLVLALRFLSRRIFGRRELQSAKVETVVGFAMGVVMFAVYLAAIGFALRELGVSLTAYFAGASVIGLAVSFGSQGVIQDAITGMSMAFADVIDVGDLIDNGGQIGIVERVGMRFTTIESPSGSRVFVLNRSFGTVVNYPDGFLRAYMDVRLPDDPLDREKAVSAVAAVAEAAHGQFSEIMPLPPTARVSRFHSRGRYECARTIAG
jgi:small-conductance mechanosensitive channel